ncbi:MAG: hypothetical protein KGY70_03575 [Bacteroidales bacterium]|nr:hypothetical protein [Bacteroidales bacterium]
MRIKWIFIILSLALFYSINSYSQKGIYSPYTRYGLGEMVDQNMGNTMGFGSITSGIRMNDVINYSNPASYTAQDTNSFIFDVGISANASLQRSSDDQITRRALGFDHLAIGFPVFRWWKSSIGIVPLSQVGYHVKTTTNPNGIDEMENRFEGEGGIRQFYIGNAFDLTKNLSVGVNYYYLFGNTTYNSTAALPEDPYSGLFQKDLNFHLRGSRFQTGLQYEFNLSENSNLTLGVSHDLSTNLDLEKSYEFFSFYQYNDNQGVTRQDTIDRIQQTKDSKFQYPQGWSGGFALQGRKLIFGADFEYQDWSTLEEEFDNLSDSYSLRGGMQYTPDEEALGSYLQRVDYRLGAFYKQSYLNLNNQQLKDFGITFGLGLPLRYNRTKFNIALKLGRRGTTSENLIEENYAMVNFNITFQDFWFIKQKYR